jgi:hypothetical protein
MINLVIGINRLPWKPRLRLIIPLIRIALSIEILPKIDRKGLWWRVMLRILKRVWFSIVRKRRRVSKRWSSVRVINVVRWPERHSVVRFVSRPQNLAKLKIGLLDRLYSKIMSLGWPVSLILIGRSSFQKEIFMFIRMLRQLGDLILDINRIVFLSLSVWRTQSSVRILLVAKFSRLLLKITWDIVPRTVINRKKYQCYK